MPGRWQTSTPEGTVEIDGNRMPPKLGQRSAADVAALQIVFQNPDSALNRRHTVRRMLKRTLAKLAKVGGRAADRRAEELVESVRLPERTLSSRPSIVLWMFLMSHLRLHLRKLTRK